MHPSHIQVCFKKSISKMERKANTPRDDRGHEGTDAMSHLIKVAYKILPKRRTSLRSS
jgi:hypothetical protein